MQKLLLTASLLGGALPALAQQLAEPAHDHRPVVSVGLPTLAAALGVQLEQPLGQHFSLGLWGSRFFSADYPGYQGGVAARYYFRPKAPLGLYLQAQAGAFSHDAQVVNNYPGANREPVPGNYSGKGGGLALGYQLALTRHLVANAALGFRAYSNWSHNLSDSHYVGDFSATGQPGSVLDGQLSVGYRL